MSKVIIVYNSSKYVYLFKKNLIRSLKEYGFSVTVVAPRDEYSDRLEKIGVSYRPVSIRNQGLSPLKDIIFLINMFKIYRDIKPDFALLYTIKPNIYGTLASATLSINVINNITGLGTVFLKRGFVQSITKLLYKYSFKFSKKVFFQNSEDMALFTDQGLIHINKATLIPGSGVDVNHFKAANSTKNGKIIFLMIGRILVDKGVLEYIEAAKLIKSQFADAEFWLLGACDTDNKSSISYNQVRCWENDGIIKYLGEVEDVRKYISDSNVVVLPSYREGMPRVLLEALSMARPVIGSNVPGCREVVNDRVNGFFCDVKNSADLAKKMEEMISIGHEKRALMGENGRNDIIKKFDEKFVIQHYLKALNTDWNDVS